MWEQKLCLPPPFPTDTVKAMATICLVKCASLYICTLCSIATKCATTRLEVCIHSSLQTTGLFTCDEGTWVHPDQWGYGVSSVLVGSGFCWTPSYFCCLKVRTPVEEEKVNRSKRVSKHDSQTFCCSWNQLCRVEESIETVCKCLDHDAVLL